MENTPENNIPDLKKECSYIRTFHNIDDLFLFTHFDINGNYPFFFYIVIIIFLHFSFCKIFHKMIICVAMNSIIVLP